MDCREYDVTKWNIAHWSFFLAGGPANECLVSLFSFLFFFLILCNVAQAGCKGEFKCQEGI